MTAVSRLATLTGTDSAWQLLAPVGCCFLPGVGRLFFLRLHELLLMLRAGWLAVLVEELCGVFVHFGGLVMNGRCLLVSSCLPFLVLLMLPAPLVHMFSVAWPLSALRREQETTRQPRELARQAEQARSRALREQSAKTARQAADTQDLVADTLAHLGVHHPHHAHLLAKARKPEQATTERTRAAARTPGTGVTARRERPGLMASGRLSN